VFSKSIKRHVFFKRSIWCSRRFVFDPEPTISSTSFVLPFCAKTKPINYL